MRSRAAAAERIREAVCAGAFLEAQDLLGLYRREVESRWAAAVSTEERSAISTEVEAILEWARTTALAARSHAQHKLILLRREGAYTSRAVGSDLDFSI